MNESSDSFRYGNDHFGDGKDSFNERKDRFCHGNDFFLEGKGPIGGEKELFGVGSTFSTTKRTFYGKNGSIRYGNDPFGDPIGPPKDKIDPFRDPKDRLGEEIDFFRKERIISVKKGSIMKEKVHRVWGMINFGWSHLESPYFGAYLAGISITIRAHRPCRRGESKGVYQGSHRPNDRPIGKSGGTGCQAQSPQGGVGAHMHMRVRQRRVKRKRPWASWRVCAATPGRLFAWISLKRPGRSLGSGKASGASASQ